MNEAVDFIQGLFKAQLEPGNQERLQTYIISALDRNRMVRCFLSKISKVLLPLGLGVYSNRCKLNKDLVMDDIVNSVLSNFPNL